MFSSPISQKQHYTKRWMELPVSHFTLGSGDSATWKWTASPNILFCTADTSLYNSTCFMEESLCWFTFWYKLLICRGLGIVVPWQAQLLGHTLSHPQWTAPSETYRARIWRCMCMRFWKLLVGSTFSSALLHELSGKSYKKKIFGSLLTSHIWVLSLKMSRKQSHMREWCLKIKKNFTYMHFFLEFSKWCIISVTHMR